MLYNNILQDFCTAGHLTYLVAAVAGAACEVVSGRLLIEKEELCGMIPASTSDTFQVTPQFTSPS